MYRFKRAEQLDNGKTAWTRGWRALILLLTLIMLVGCPDDDDDDTVVEMLPATSAGELSITALDVEGGEIRSYFVHHPIKITVGITNDGDPVSVHAHIGLIEASAILHPLS